MIWFAAEATVHSRVCFYLLLVAATHPTHHPCALSLRGSSLGYILGYRAGAEIPEELACRPMSTDHSVAMEPWNSCGCSLVSLCLRPNLTQDSHVCESSTRVLVRTHWITQSKFQISLQPDWQLNNGFFNRPIMVHTQILVHRWRPRTRISSLACQQTYPWGLVSSVVQAIPCPG